MNVKVIAKDTGKAVGTLSREAAEEMVGNDPELFAIQEPEPEVALVEAVEVIESAALLASIVEHQQEAELPAPLQLVAQALLEEEKKPKKARPVKKKPVAPDPPIESPKVEEPLPKVKTAKSKLPPKKRDNSPKRTEPWALDQHPVSVKPTRRADIYQLTDNPNLFRIKTSHRYSYRKMFGEVGIIWLYPSNPVLHTQCASFQVEDKRRLRDITETLKGLGCVKVDYMPWTLEEYRQFCTI
jgi:hypothetical protein